MCVCRGGGGGGGGEGVLGWGGGQGAGYEVNSDLSQFALILFNSYTFFGQFALNNIFFGQFVLIWSTRTHLGQFVLVLVNSFSR